MGDDMMPILEEDYSNLSNENARLFDRAGTSSRKHRSICELLKYFSAKCLLMR